MIIQCDFDGTITRNNLSILLREKYACGNWRKIDVDYLHGRLTVEQSNQMQFTLIKEPEEKLQEFIRQHIEVRPGFAKFISYCRKNGIPIVIVSSGLDFYIKTVLNNLALSDLELHCGQTCFGKDGINITYRDPKGEIITEGFKRKYLTSLKKRDQSVIYIGDGLSDLEAACLADYILATGQLPELLRAESVPYHSFSDFHDVIRQLHLFK